MAFTDGLYVSLWLLVVFRRLFRFIILCHDFHYVLNGLNHFCLACLILRLLRCTCLAFHIIISTMLWTPGLDMRDAHLLAYKWHNARILSLTFKLFLTLVMRVEFRMKHQRALHVLLKNMIELSFFLLWNRNWNRAIRCQATSLTAYWIVFVTIGSIKHLILLRSLS